MRYTTDDQGTWGPKPFFAEDDRTQHEKYLDNQRELREQGFTAYNCDYVDEFPRYGQVKLMVSAKGL